MARLPRTSRRDRAATLPPSTGTEHHQRNGAAHRALGLTATDEVDGAIAAVPAGPRPAVGFSRFVPRTFESFRNREFRWFYVSMLGQMASMNMQLVVRGYLAYDLTGSYAVLGLVGLAGAVPMLMLSAFGGVMADRLPKKTQLQVAQAASGLNALALAVLLFSGLMTIEWLLVSAFAQGIVMSLTMPARQAMIPEIVGMDRLTNAVSLNIAGMNTMRLFSPAIGGFIVSLAGFGWAFGTMALLYALALVALARITWQPATAPGNGGESPKQIGLGALRDIRDGLVYIKGDRMMSVLLGVSFISSVFGMPYIFLLPGYVADIFDGGGSEVGLLISISAIGSLVGALVLASMPDRRRGLVLLAGTMLLGAGLFAFAQTTDYWIAAGIMVAVGLGSTTRQALGQGLLHSYVDNAYRGRVMSVYMTQFSMMQFGVFLIGVIAEAIGIRVAFAGLAICLMVATGIAFALSPRLRRVD